MPASAAPNCTPSWLRRWKILVKRLSRKTTSRCWWWSTSRSLRFVAHLEYVSGRGLIGSRLNEMGAAEGGEEIVQRHFVAGVLHCESKRPTRSGFLVEQVVGADADIEETVRFHPIRIMVVIFGAGLRQRQQRRSSRSIAGSDGRCKRGRNSIASEPDVHLLRRR